MKLPHLSGNDLRITTDRWCCIKQYIKKNAHGLSFSHSSHDGLLRPQQTTRRILHNKVYKFPDNSTKTRNSSPMFSSYVRLRISLFIHFYLALSIFFLIIFAKSTKYRCYMYNVVCNFIYVYSATEKNPMQPQYYHDITTA